MDFSTLLLGALMTVLLLIGAGLLAAMVLLERPDGRSAVPTNAPPPSHPRHRRSDARRRR
jgi:hypothetical protein